MFLGCNLKKFVIFQISTHEFFKNGFLTNTVNFGVAPALSKDADPTFFEGPGPSPGLLDKIFPSRLCNFGFE